MQEMIDNQLVVSNLISAVAGAGLGWLTKVLYNFLTRRITNEHLPVSEFVQKVCNSLDHQGTHDWQLDPSYKTEPLLFSNIVVGNDGVLFANYNTVPTNKREKALLKKSYAARKSLIEQNKLRQAISSCVL